MDIKLNVNFKNAIFTDGKGNDWSLYRKGRGLIILKKAAGHNISDHDTLHVPLANLELFSIKGIDVTEDGRKLILLESEVKDGKKTK